eukprot:jgi/Orpsp1_1/1182508/evm.model.c7180000081560.1
MSTYALSRDLDIPPISGSCAALQVKSFAKWIRKYNCVKYEDIKEYYWNSISKFQGIKGQNYDNAKFVNNKSIILLSLEYPQFNLGFFMDHPFNVVVTNSILLLQLE